MAPEGAGYSGTKIAQKCCRLSDLGGVQDLTGQGLDLLDLF